MMRVMNGSSETSKVEEKDRIEVSDTGDNVASFFDGLQERMG